LILQKESAPSGNSRDTREYDLSGHPQALGGIGLGKQMTALLAGKIPSRLRFRYIWETVWVRTEALWGACRCESFWTQNRQFQTNGKI